MTMRRTGFTLIEMMITVGLTAVVFGELVVVLVGLFQMEKQKMWDSELATKLRVAREHLLFSALPADGERIYAGILSSTNLVWSSPHITAAFQYAEDSCQGGVGENEDVSERFLVQNVDDGERDVPPVFITNSMFFVNTAVTVNGSNRTERIAVTAFGKTDDRFLYDFMDLENQGEVRWIP